MRITIVLATLIVGLCLFSTAQADDMNTEIAKGVIKGAGAHAKNMTKEALAAVQDKMAELYEKYSQAFERLMRKHKFVCAPICIGLGIVLACYGLKIVHFSLFFFSWLAFVGGLLMIDAIKKAAFPKGLDLPTQEELRKDPKKEISEIEANWVVLMILVALGLAFAYFMLKLIRIGIFCLGAGYGMTLGDELYYYIVAKFYPADSPSGIENMILICCIVAALIGGMIALLAIDHALIGVTSLGGAMIFTKGIRIFITAEIPGFYFKIFWFALALLALLYQEHLYHNEDDEARDKRHEFLGKKKKEKEE